MYAGTILICTALLTYMLLHEQGGDWGAQFRTSLFQVVSMITSTGFASVDFNQWSDQLKVVLIVAMLVSGCAGSAGGGPKSIRILLSFRHIWRQLKQSLYPKAA